MKAFRTTSKWKYYWANRKINWQERYFNWDHPHRYLISAALTKFQWTSLLEMGVGAGANLANILKHFKNKQLGGVDVSEDAIACAKKNLVGALLKVGSVEDVMISDSATDVVLSDMCLIYLGPRRIHKALDEIKRITRNYVVFCEFHHPSFIKRLWLKLTEGYYAYDYKKLLAKHGYYDIQLFKIPPEFWEGGKPQATFGYIIIARVPKRK